MERIVVVAVISTCQEEYLPEKFASPNARTKRVTDGSCIENLLRTSHAVFATVNFDLINWAT